MNPGNDDSSPIWLLYANGGGMGHLTRAMSLARQAAKQGVRCRILSNSPFLNAITFGKIQPMWEVPPLISLVPISPTLDRDGVASITRREIRLCRKQDVLVVDTFSRGIGGELASFLHEIPAFKVFIHRDLNLHYIRWGNLEQSLGDYDFVLVPGDSAPLEHLANARTEPWMICDANELMTCADARSFFGIEASNPLPLVVVSGSGNSEEAVASARLTRQLVLQLESEAILRFASLDAGARVEAKEWAVSPWPLLKLLPGIDLLIGAGGYHTVYEARSTGTPLLASAQMRLYDRQLYRLRECERIVDSEQLASQIRRILTQSTSAKSRQPPCYRNGAAEAFEIISTFADRHLTV